ncbi:MAG: ABC transporter permease, partial [Acidobacteriaceae bacterium]|nr:ABC transporter permease [Acidobacteriaceae bacterium]
MNTQTRALSDSFEAQRVAPATLSVMHPFYWSLRRELWENRWIYIGQLAVAAIFLIVFFINMAVWVAKMRGSSTTDVAHYWEIVTMPYNIGAGVMMGTLILMSLFYSADALYGERRDRSILFWKSLPVSDLSSVLAKASIPLFFLPLLTIAVTLVMQIIMLLISGIILPAHGMSLVPVWREL